MIRKSMSGVWISVAGLGSEKYFPGQPHEHFSFYDYQ